MSNIASPKVPTKAWRTLRAKAASAPSTKFTAANVAAMLEFASPASAQANIIRPMRALGIFDEDGSLTLLGNKWRNDATYHEACQEMLDKVYPADLAALVEADGSPSAGQVKTWFSHKGFGASNATQMAATYVMIASKQLPEAPSATEDKKAAPPAKTKSPSPKKPADSARQTAVPSPKHDPVPVAQPSQIANPGLHLDIQIHVPAEASADQIDAIFRSMAKHLYGRETD